MHDAVALVAMLAVSLALALRTANAHAAGLTADACTTFRVYHTSSQQEDRSKDAFLTIFDENGEVPKCFWPQRSYWVKLNSSSVMRGFLLQAQTGARLPSSGFDLPVDVTRGPCSNSLSHTQIRTKNSPELFFPITTRRSTRPLHLRYTVVFSFGSYLEDRHLQLNCCSHYQPVVGGENGTLSPLPTVNSGSSVPESGNGSGSGVTVAPPTSQPYATMSPLGTPVNGTCGKTVENTIVTRNETRDGKRYNCTIKKPLKQTHCSRSCELNREPAQCQVFKHIPRRKGYTCVPYTDGDQARINVSDYTFSDTFNEVVTSGCQCFTVGRSSTPDSSESSGD